MKKYFEKFIKIPLIFKIKLIFFPFFYMHQIILSWLKSLWNSRVLFDGKSQNYMGFCPNNSINSLYYRTQWMNFERHGRNGVSKTLSTGNYDLRKLWHLSLAASSIYSKSGAVTTLFGTLFWILSHFVWLGNVDWWWGLLVILFVWFSTFSLCMAFAKQNYQILGWMWFPIAMYFTNSEQILFSITAWFFAALFGVTQLFFGAIIILFFCLDFFSLYPLVNLLAFAPILIVILSRMESGSGLANLSQTAKWLGLFNNVSKYSRKLGKIDLELAYFIIIYAITTLLFWFSIQQLPIFLVLGFVILIINQMLFRVADSESVYMFFSTVLIFTALKHDPSVISFICIIFAINPIGYFLSLQTKDNYNFSSIRHFKPFDHSQLKQKMEIFFKDVKPDSKVFFSFSDPKNYHYNIFDGYRTLIELPNYVANEKKILLFPNWEAVFDNNYSTAPSLWGRKLCEVLTHCKNFDASHCLVYSNDNNKTLGKDWLKEFEIVGEFDWSKEKEVSQCVYVWRQNLGPPKWFLLRKK